MRGGTLTRYRPDDYGQKGRGLVGDVFRAAAREGWKGLKTGGTRGLPNISGGIRGVKRGGKRVLKRKALEKINQVAKRRLTDIFGE